MDFKKILLEDLTEAQKSWLVPCSWVKKLSFKQMLEKLAAREYDLWLLGEPAVGLAVTYPEKDLLFIYYLHGNGLFGSLTIEDLTTIAKNEGLSGMLANVDNLGMKRILERLGFKVILESPYGYEMELRYGRA